MNGNKWLWLVQIVIGGLVTLLFALGNGVASKIDRHDSRLSAEEAATASARAQFDGIVRQLNRIEDKLDRVVER